MKRERLGRGAWRVKKARGDEAVRTSNGGNDISRQSSGFLLPVLSVEQGHVLRALRDRSFDARQAPEARVGTLRHRGLSSGLSPVVRRSTLDGDDLAFLRGQAVTQTVTPRRAVRFAECRVRRDGRSLNGFSWVKHPKMSKVMGAFDHVCNCRTSRPSAHQPHRAKVKAE